MNKAKPLGVTNIIGIVLVIVALVSAGGLYYLASEYSKISETLVSTESIISDIRITQNNATGDVTFSISLAMDNPSNLDIELYRIEYLTYMDKYEASQVGSDKYVGSGSTSEGNKTVPANSMRDFQISFIISSNSVYMPRYDNALDGDNTLFAYVNGYVWYKLSDYPDVTQKQPIGSMKRVVVEYV